jgi:hypothetical protein
LAIAALGCRLKAILVGLDDDDGRSLTVLARNQR